jgi:hypothetical protein
VPVDPDSAHDAHVPAHAVEQQMNCSQWAELHIAAAVHAAPLGNLPQLMLTQLFGDTQSVLAPQVVLQVGVAVSQTYGSQAELVTDRQTPVPSQVRCGVSVEPMQVAAAHWVPAAQKRHAPVPLHIPSVPQPVEAVVMHCVAGVGAVPLGTLLQVPTLPVSAHDLHVPVQAALQQTPWAQNPESHSFAVPHAVPIGLSVHLPALQTFGATQSVAAVAVVQLVLHALVVMSQVY